MRRLRSTSIGSMSAWLPSRRSTEHHNGAFWRRRLGQVRSCSTTGIHGWYFSNDIFLGVTGLRGIRRLLWLSGTSVIKRAHQALTDFLGTHPCHPQHSPLSRSCGVTVNCAQESHESAWTLPWVTCPRLSPRQAKNHTQTE